jgi:integrase
VAHVEKRSRDGKVSWRARYREPDGRERSRTFARRSDAERFMHSIEHRKATGGYTDPDLGKTRLSDWAHRWLDSVAPSLKPTTHRRYADLLRLRVLPDLGGMPLAQVRASDVQRVVGRMEGDGLAPSSIRQAIVVLAQVLDAAERDGLVVRNVARGVKLPRIQRREAAYFDPTTVDAIAAAMPSPTYRLAVLVLGRLGLRWGELAGLRRHHVDPMRRRLLVEETLVELAGKLHEGVTKTHAARSVPVPRSLMAELLEHLDERVPIDPMARLFTTPTGTPLRHRAFYGNVWVPALGRLGLSHAGLHSLRHSAAAGMISAGASAKAVQSVLGHGSAAFTLTVYGHLLDDDLDALAERIDELPRPQRGPARIVPEAEAGS